MKAHALLHRKHRERNDAGVIVATIDDDYEPVRALLADVLATSAEVKLAKAISDTVKAVATLQRPDRADLGVTARALGEYLNLDRTAAWRRLHAAELAGYVINLEERRGRPGRYQAEGFRRRSSRYRTPADLRAVTRGDTQAEAGPGK